ncbi:L10-interacting MYB domain-containing protein-like isoform X2 [Cornus florida]|uniref:L10-interacting MYB domain-containing protein-like isoform X2 n=1 Tax=Cornus florida TaxID=4283 RepID=UPI0028999322|nr:L10-interacting MYB domain-containing protein-like isoform X2 [Cornus florida]
MEKNLLVKLYSFPMTQQSYLLMTRIHVGPSQVVEWMEKQGPNSSDRLRTTWTPTMDRYFIEIMIEQVQKGHKNNTIFRKKAWKNMVTLFNMEFELGVEKDVLKNRLKKLRTRYFTLKSLLEHGEFCWDETRQMVTADDQVWDDYIKAHPEARAYRTTTVPDFANLSIIFGNENSKGRNNGLDHTVEFTNGMHEGKIGGESGGSQSATISAAHGDQCGSSQLVEGVDNRETPTTERSKTNWKPPMDRYFIEIMLEEIHRGNTSGTSFRKEAWTHMLDLLNSKFGLQLDKETLRVRFRKLRMQYNAVKILLDHGGFHWDETRQMVVASDIVWDNYLKAHPEAQAYRTKTLPCYNDMSVIFRNSSADGGHSFSGHNLDFNDTSGKKIVAFGDPVDIQESSSHSGGGVDTSNQLGKRPFVDPSNSHDSRKARRSTDERMVDALRQMAFAVTSLANNKKENQSSISFEQVVNALKAVPDIDEDLFLDACDLLEDEQKAKMFLALDVTIRKKWLMRKLRPQ